MDCSTKEQLSLEKQSGFTMSSHNEALAKYAFDFFHLLSKEKPSENIVFSPVNLTAALSLLLYGSQPDTEAEIEKVLQLKKVEGHVNSEIRSYAEKLTSTNSSRSEGSVGPEVKETNKDLNSKEESKAETTVRDAESEAEGTSSSSCSTSEDQESHSVPSVAELISHIDTEEDTPFYFIPWRNHLQGIEKMEKASHEQLYPEGIELKTLANIDENQEEPSVNKDKAVADASQSMSFSNAEIAAENFNTLLREFQSTVKHADDNMQALKEVFGIFKECCDKMCISMSNLQGVLETLIIILRE